MNNVKIPRWQAMVLYFALIFLLFSLSFWILVSQSRSVLVQADAAKGGGVFPVPGGFGDLAALLFGASSVAMVVLSLLVGLVALVGWDQLAQSAHNQAIESSKLEVRRLVAENVGKEVLNQITEDITSRFNALERITRGRLLVVQGHALGEVSCRPDELEPTNHDQLLMAIRFCREGFDLLNEAEPRSAGRFMALNNLLFYSSVAARKEDREFCLRSAQELKEAANNHPTSPVLNTLWLTYCRAIYAFSADLLELREAELVAARVLAGRDLMPSIQHEAAFIEKELTGRIRVLKLAEKSE